MKEGVPSRTALGAARLRAAHQTLDDAPVFRDPVVGQIIDPDRSNSPSSRGLRAFVAVRSRYAEDHVEAFVECGGKQCVILGAGLDTFAYRNAYGPELQVFELDKTETQSWKVQSLLAVGIAIPDSVHFVALDFETDDLLTTLRGSRAFHHESPTLFTMLGVVPYLTRSAFVCALSVISSMAGSVLVLDYVDNSDQLVRVDKARLKRLSARVAMAGECFRLLLTPLQMNETLRFHGFTMVEDLGKEQINERYFKGRSDQLKVESALGRLLTASVDPRT